MKRIRPQIELSEEDLIALKDLAGCYEITVSDIIKNYICDLVYSKESNGSDERELANDYFLRSIENYRNDF